MTRLDRLLSQLTRELADLSGLDPNACTFRVVLVRSADQLGLLAELEHDGHTQLVEGAGPHSLDVLRAACAALRATSEDPKEGPAQ